MKRISTQLVISFLIVALLPALPLSLVVRDLLERRFGPALAEPIGLALESGLEESKTHLRQLRSGLVRWSLSVADTNLVAPAILLDNDGFVQPPDSLASFFRQRPGLWEKAKALELPAAGELPVAERLGDVLVLRTQNHGGLPTLVLQPLPAGMVERAGDMTAGVALLRVVRESDERVVFSFIGPFLLIYGLLILVGLFVGIVWSRQMIRPLETLVAATRRVASGDLDFRIQRQGPGEVGELVQSFDQMVGNLAEQRRDLARLERAAAWRGMARTLAHEVKNPLTPILLAVNQARDCYPGDDDSYRALLAEVSEIVEEEVESLRRLVREFGDFARLPKPELQRADLNEMLSDLTQLYGPERLHLLVDSPLPEAWVDRDALRRALINLIDNGLAACAEAERPPEVELKAEIVSAKIQLAVTDHGGGISEDHRALVFEPDFTTKSGGMGLGLAIVENIVLGHGGSIALESEVGRGTCLTITLPLTPPSGRQNSGGMG